MCVKHSRAAVLEDQRKRRKERKLKETTTERQAEEIGEGGGWEEEGVEDQQAQLISVWAGQDQLRSEWKANRTEEVEVEAEVEANFGSGPEEPAKENTILSVGSRLTVVQSGNPAN